MKLILPLMLMMTSLCFGTTYYVDFAAGNDASAGTSTGTAWKTIPGSRTTDGTAYLNAAWGGITTSSPIADGDTIVVKGGTTYTSASGGYIWLTSASGFYSAGYTGITITTNGSFGSGNAVLDGTGMAIGLGLIALQIDGVTFRGLTIRDSDLSGIHGKEKTGTSAQLTNITVADCTFIANGESYVTDGGGAADGQILMRDCQNLTLTNCIFDGGGNFINGAVFGTSNRKVRGANIIGCIATNHIGNDDCGIGFKGFNSQLVFDRCISTNNYKGWDLGEQGGNGVNISYKIKNCTAANNNFGFNFNAFGSIEYAGTVDFYLINSKSYNNTENGANIYAGPFNLYLVHNLFANNGGALFGNGNLIVTADNNAHADGSQIRAYLYNNIFYKPAVASDVNLVVNYFDPATNNFTLDSDYNSWTQLASEDAMWWSVYASSCCPPGLNNTTYAYGGNGPGQTSGDWYSNYSYNTTPPAYCLGHFHCDSHSVGTGSSVSTTPPPLTDPSANSYALTNHFAGIDLTGKSWFIPEMGLNANGSARTSPPDMGPQDVDPSSLPPLKGPQLLRRFRLKLR